MSSSSSERGTAETTLASSNPLRCSSLPSASFESSTLPATPAASAALTAIVTSTDEPLQKRHAAPLSTLSTTALPSLSFRTVQTADANTFFALSVKASGSIPSTSYPTRTFWVPATDD
eukprot:CAMPEP_0173455532 /NCGR_PEP_ID=MMETSP1357-20121228/54428_1 /TAXON_ID=77926 /ORGANISM="Hemiselmis rufescens, Strain PCC563" /LENGTH=117 /DNA_ID=CAMNT_0014422673 /DNA_START=28 /DNA_END=378 /DNA_ORIENTATION=-